jgi:uncharacterized protein (DUF983 family)
MVELKVFALISKKESDDTGEDMLLCCPKCGHTKLYYEAGMKLGPLYHCKSCGYIGTFVIEANRQLKQLIQNGKIRETCDKLVAAEDSNPLNRRFLYLAVGISVISYAITALFPEYSTIFSFVWFFLYLALILVFVYLAYK